MAAVVVRKRLWQRLAKNDARSFKVLFGWLMLVVDINNDCHNKFCLVKKD